ncbi:MAG: YIP1 family protein [Bacteroidota bacterium]
MDTPQASPPAAGAAEQLSFTDKLVGIFASPGELFVSVARNPVANSNWVVPTVILALVGALLGFVVMNNPVIADQIQQMATQQMDEQFQKAIREGRMTQEQADQARSQAESFGKTGIMVSSIAGPLIGPFIALFAWSLVYWLLGKAVMKASTPYLKVSEVYGLTNYIALLGAIVTTIMMIGMEKFTASPSAAVFISDFSPMDTWHRAASALNIFTFWQLGVIGIGLARIFQRDTAKVVVLIAAIWVLWTAALIFGLSAFTG